MDDHHPHPQSPTLKEIFDAAVYRPQGWHEAYFTNQFRNQLRYGFAPGFGNEKKGTIILTHGYGEFIELYYQAIQEYQHMGFDVWTMDFYGFGKSGRDDPDNPHRPSTKGMLRHVRDLDFFLKNVVKQVPEKPLIMSTHSMGGHIGLLYLERHPGVFNAAIMSAPMFDIFRFGLPWYTRPMVRLIFNIASVIGFRDRMVPATPGTWERFTRVGAALTDTAEGGLRAAFNEMMRSALPETRIDRPTFGWVAKSFSTIIASTRGRRLKSVRIPILLGTAGIESLVSNDETERAARLMPNATLINLPTARHGLWFENNKNYDLWLGAIRRFLHKVTTGKDCTDIAPQQPSPDDLGRSAKIRAAFPIPSIHPGSNLPPA